MYNIRKESGIQLLCTLLLTMTVDWNFNFARTNALGFLVVVVDGGCGCFTCELRPMQVVKGKEDGEEGSAMNYQPSVMQYGINYIIRWRRSGIHYKGKRRGVRWLWCWCGLLAVASTVTHIRLIPCRANENEDV